MIDLSTPSGGVNDPIAASADLNAAMLENQAWLATLERPGAETIDAYGEEGAGGSRGISIGIEGAGQLVLDDGGTRRFASTATLHVGADGRLVDAFGRAAVGRMLAEGGDGRLQPLRVSKAMPHLYGYDIDARGTWYATTVTRATRSKPAALRRVDLGRLALAVFAAPQELRPAGPSAFAATASSGAARYVVGGAANVGSFAHNPARPTFDDLLANLRALWALSGRAEIEVALASSRDSLARTALNLVR